MEEQTLYEISPLERGLEESRNSLRRLTHEVRNGIPEELGPRVRYLQRQEGRRLDDIRRDLIEERRYS
jgi:DNA anti-recombination protein RmuC